MGDVGLIAQALDAINDARRKVMDLYGGNLDHPALGHLEAAMREIVDTHQALPKVLHNDGGRDA